MPLPVTDKNIERMERIIKLMSGEDLKRLGRAIQKRREELAGETKKDLRIGTPVSFNDNDGNKLYGVVHKVNPKRIKVQVTGGSTWNVWPHHITIEE